MGTPRKVSKDRQPSCQALSLPTGVSFVDMRALDLLLPQTGISGTNGLEPGDGQRYRPRMGREHLVRRSFSCPGLGLLVSTHHSSLCPGEARAQGWPPLRSATTGMIILDGGSPTGGPSSQVRLDPAGDSG